MATRRITDDQRARDLLLWARKQRIAVAELTVGDVHLVVADLAIGSDTKPKTDEERRASLYAQYGGQPFAEAAKQNDENSTFDEDDDD